MASSSSPAPFSTRGPFAFIRVASVVKDLNYPNFLGARTATLRTYWSKAVSATGPMGIQASAEQAGNVSTPRRLRGHFRNTRRPASTFGNVQRPKGARVHRTVHRNDSRSVTRRASESRTLRNLRRDRGRRRSRRLWSREARRICRVSHDTCRFGLKPIRLGGHRKGKR